MFSQLGSSKPKEVFHTQVNKLQKLLYHSAHQTPEFLHWLETGVTLEQKQILEGFAENIMDELLSGVSLIGQDNNLLNYYFAKSVHLCRSIPDEHTCELKLSDLNDTANQLKQAFATFNQLITDFIPLIEPVANAKINEILQISWDFGLTANAILEKINKQQFSLRLMYREFMNRFDAARTIERDNLLACCDDLIQQQHPDNIEFDTLDKLSHRMDNLEALRIQYEKILIIAKKYFIKKADTLVLWLNLKKLNKWLCMIDQIDLYSYPKWRTMKNIEWLISHSGLARVLNTNFNDLIKLQDSFITNQMANIFP